MNYIAPNAEKVVFSAENVLLVSLENGEATTEATNSKENQLPILPF